MKVIEAGIWSWIPDFWNLSLVSLDGSPITFGKIITGILLFIVGYFICKTLSQEFEKKVLTHLDIDTSLRHTLRTIVFYFLLIVLTLFVLRLLNVPLTIFTVLGGALAIGVGFGSQNIVNNFISGLILMIERPIKVGDIIEVVDQDLRGTVENIGARSTTIKSMDNTHYVVPNSSFLEKNVLNWTLSDNMVRVSVKVGVAYGSPVNEVRRLLLESLKGHEKILEDPNPLVLFTDFADNSLNFEVYFWTHVTHVMNMRVLQSDIRFSINQVFEENHIVIAFPQRDVHLDASHPIQIEVVNRDKS